MTSQDHIPPFIARQKYLLQDERQADIERSSLVLSSCGPKLLELRGLALLGLGVASIAIGLGGKSLIELERPSAYHTTPQFPPHTFRPGDIAKIEENTSTSKSATSKKSKKVEGSESAGTKGVEGVVYKVNDTKIIIAVDNESGDIDLPERCRLLKLANSVTFDRMDRAIEQLERILLGTSSSESADKSDNKSTKAPTPLTQVLMGLIPPSERVSAVTEGLKFLDESLNQSQKEAVRHALESPEVALIHGPPGTGKTHTLVEVIRQLVAQDKRVLVCGASNLAVDNLLERLVPHGIPLTRIGHPARVLGALHTSTLEHQASKSDESQLAKDVKEEIEELMGTLTGKGKGKSGKLKGAERRKLWDDVKELRKEYRKREGVVVKSVMSKAKIVLATCHGAGSRQLFNLEFDVVIIDEATQAVEAVCWIPILKSKKLILAGDPMQLPPTVISTGSERKKKAIAASSTKNVSNTSSKAGKSATKGQAAPEPIEDESEGEGSEEMDEVLEDEEDEDEGASTTSAPSKTSTKKAKTKFKMGTLKPSKSLEVTLFDRLEKMYGRKIIKMLTVQYRMHELICSFPSSVLYKKKLKSHPSVKKHLLRDLPSISQAESDIDVVGLPVVFFDTAGCEYFERVDGEGGSADEGSRSNENEALVVKQWVEKLVEAGVQPSQIALITPYQAQVSLLTSMMKHAMPDLEIGTVDGMQGREKDAVILSLVRSNDKREVGFLKEKRRLNVAMTRPRRHLCVVGDSATVSSGSPYLKQWMGWLEENADVRFGGLD